MKIFIALFFLVLAPQIAFSDTACKEDLNRLCPGLSGEAAEKCFRQNVTKWSEPCKAQIKVKMDAVLAKNPEAKTRIEKSKASAQEIKALASACLEKTKALQVQQSTESNALAQKIKDERAQTKKSDTTKFYALRTELRKKHRAEIAAIPECAALKKK